ncbi:5-oxoprolinase subunit PxpB [Sediminibacillus dalangtanensis]|uniref:5-oxoprolinase subunit PxpB n=1 Tax=Sediminibacillus dalangtanensis TaxID=2729421 RepID=A0ABX7VU14_9BACI|nr:5-oxoprolinase subunit PxpB [Sediminibacillus dalangtanensis]QTN00448.1 5-oxoprolinase subunit PxpB [Sediminibacillus dalangtanensis]
MESIQKKLSFFPLSESAILIDFGEPISVEKNMYIHQLTAALNAEPFPGFIEVVPAYTTLTVYYDPLAADSSNPYHHTCTRIEHAAHTLKTDKLETKTIELPVCYDPEFALDITEVANHNGLSPEEVIERHTTQVYHVYFIGFAPGFPFLGGLDSTIATPRKQSPRRETPAGSVGIAGRQTGVYPIDIPGGWQIIGRTPRQLLHLNDRSPALLQPGDKVRFHAISKQEYLRQEES